MGKTAIYFGKDADQSYAELAESVSHISAWLLENGFECGDNVAIFMNNRSECLGLLFGIWHAGGVVVPINAKLHPKEAAWIFQDASVQLAFVESKLEKVFLAELKKVSP